MLSIKEYSYILKNYPIENHCFSLVGGLTILETEYLEKLVKFENDHPASKLSVLLFNKLPFADLSIRRLYRLEDIVSLIFYVQKYFVTKDLNYYYKAIERILGANYFGCNDEEHISILNNVVLIDEQEYNLIFYIFQAYIVKSIIGNDCYIDYHNLCNKFEINNKYRWGIESQSYIVDKLKSKHYSSGIMALCYTRLAFVSSDNLIFPDCCITSLRNFINTLLYEPVYGNFNIDLLNKVDLKIHSNIFKFYNKCNDIEHVQYHYVHNEWAELTKGLNKFNKNIKYNTPNHEPVCELLPGVINMLRICKVLFGTADVIRIVNEFNKFRETKIHIDMSSFSIRNRDLADYQNKISLTVNNETLNWYFLKQHFRTDKNEIGQRDIDHNIVSLSFANCQFLKMLLDNCNNSFNNNSISNKNYFSDALYILSYQIRSPEDAFNVINGYVRDFASSIDMYVRQLLSGIFNSIPNDAYHLYNKYVLLDELNKITPGFIDYLNISKEQSYHEQYN